MRRYYSLLFTICLIFSVCTSTLLTSCASKRKAVKDSADGTTSATAVTTKPTGERKQEPQVVALVNQNRQTATGLRSRMNIKLAAGGKSASVGGTLKMKRDEVVQLTLTALGLFEVGRMELTPDYLFVLDRVNKQYVQVRWSDIEPLRAVGADFYTFQALFWNQLFVLGSKNMPSQDDFRTETSGKRATLMPKNQHTAVNQEALQFVVNTSLNLIEQAKLSTAKSQNLNVTCDYSDFNKLEGKSFPNGMNLAITAGAKRYSANIDLSGPQVDENMKDLVTKPNSSYRRVSFDDIIKQLIK